MTENNELSHTIERVEQLLNQDEVSGAILSLEYVRIHATTAVKLIKDQSSAMTEQALKIKELTERVAYWQKRDETHEAEIKELDEQEPLGYVVRGCFFSSKEQAEKSATHLTEYHENCTADPVYTRPVPAKSVPDGERHE